MMRASLLAAMALVAAVPATAAADTTPAGPATLTPGANDACGGIAYLGSQLLLGWEATVGEGGRSGIVRPKFGETLGDPVELPAQPGTYRFPAPRMEWYIGCSDGVPALVQMTGEHALLVDDTPAATWVTVARDGQPDERINGKRLTLRAITERDFDRDGLGDVTEDRTDLRVSVTPARDADGRARAEVLVTNAGPLAADLPRLEAKNLQGARWEGICQTHMLFPSCLTTRLAAGESRLFRLRGDLPDAVAGEVTIVAEGSDLAPADNTAAVTLPAAPAFDVVAASSQRLSRGLKLQLRGVRAGRARISVTFGGKTVKLGRVVRLVPYTARNVTIRPAGAKLRSLRRALAGGALSAQVTVRTINGKTPVMTKVTVTR